MTTQKALLAVFSLATSSFALASPAEISNVRLSGDCAFDDIHVEEEGGEYFIVAAFDSITAQSFSGQPNEKKRCTMDYDLRLAPGYSLELFQFSVNGVYQLSDQGTARLTVSHRAANGKSVRVTEFFSQSQGHAPFGDINDQTGDITRFDLQPVYQGCGAQIPLNTSIFAQASQPNTDQSGQTLISLDDGTSSAYYKLCKIQVQACRP